MIQQNTKPRTAGVSLCLVMLFIVTACVPASPKSFPPLETKDASEPIFTPEPPTPTFTSTPTPYPFVTDGTPLPPLEPITEDNVNRLVKVAEWGRGYLTDAEWSPDGKMIAVGTPAGIYLYESSSLKQIRFIRPADLGIEIFSGFEHVAFSPDAISIATFIRDYNPSRVRENKSESIYKVIQINVASGKLDRVIGELQGTPNKWIESGPAYSPDGQKVATGTIDGEVHIWDVASGSLIQTLGTDGKGVIDVLFSPDGSTLVAVTTSVYFWDVGSWSIKHRDLTEELWEKSVTPSSLDFSPNSQMLVMDDGEEGPTIVNLSTNEITTLPSEQPFWFTDVDFSPDGTKIAGLQSIGFAASFVGNKVYVWDVNGNIINKYEQRYKSASAGFIEFSPDNTKIATILSDQIFRVFDATDLQVLNSIQLNDEIEDADFSPEGTIVGTVGGYSNYSIWMRSTSTGEITRLYVGNTAKKIVFSLDGNLVANDSLEEFEDNVTGHVWNARGDNLLFMFRLPEVDGSAWSEAGPIFSPDSSFLISSYTIRRYINLNQPPINESNIYLWSTTEGELKQVIKGDTGSIDELAISQNGQWLAASTENGIKTWQMPSGSLVNSISGHSHSPIVFSPDNKYLVVLVSSLQLWDTTSWDKIWEIEIGGWSAVHSQKGDAIQITPDSKLLILTSEEMSSEFNHKGIQILRLSDGVLLKSLYDPNELGISDIEISPDGTMLAVSLHSGIIQIWGVPK